MSTKVGLAVCTFRAASYCLSVLHHGHVLISQGSTISSSSRLHAKVGAWRVQFDASFIASCPATKLALRVFLLLAVPIQAMTTLVGEDFLFYRSFNGT